MNPLRRFWSHSLTRQLMLGIAMVHAVMMTIFVFDLVEKQRTFLVEQNRQQAMGMARTLANSASSWVLSSDIVGMEELIASQAHFPALRYAMFLDLHGKVLAYSDRSQVGRYISDPASRQLIGAPAKIQFLIDDDQLIDLAAPILVGNSHIGWTRVGISRVGITNNLQLVTKDGLIYTFFAIAVGILFAWFMAHGLTRDLRLLAKASARVRDGERSIDFTLSRQDELGQLATAFDSTVKSLASEEAETQRARLRLQHSEERLQLALAGASDGLWDWNMLNQQVYYSPRWKSMLGYGEEEVQNQFAEWERLVHPEDLPAAKNHIEQHLRGASPSYEATLRMRHKSGEWHWILTRGKVLRNDEGEAVRMVGTHVDVTERHLLEERLHNEHERALVTLESIGDGVITTDEQGLATYLNPVAEHLTGWKNHEAHGQPLSVIFPLCNEFSHEVMVNPVTECLRQGRTIGLAAHTMLTNRRGEQLSIEDSAAPIRARNGQIIGAVLVFHDATAQRRLQHQIEYQAKHDPLTDLWNRNAFEKRLEDLRHEALASNASHALLYIDLDQFKVVNDTVGHIAGDEMLRQASLLLSKRVRASDMLARLGGDEFGVLLSNCDLQHAYELAEAMRQTLVEFCFVWQENSFRIGASIGIAEISAATATENLMGLADLACYNAKERGRNQVHVYSLEDKELALRHVEMRWVSRIESALAQQQLLLYGQAILDLSQPQSGQPPLFREILVRMQSLPGKDPLLPGLFIPAAERYGLMPKVDAFVVNNALNWLQRQPHSEQRLSINLSGRSLSDQPLLEEIKQRLTRHPEIAHRICFEVTETAAISNLRDVLDFMLNLKSLGVSFALDDFGSGLSSFAYLKNLPVDYIKIDGSFVRDIVTDPVDAAMVKAITEISREMNIQTIAEFVEDEATLQLLKKLGVNFAQGYYIQQPTPLM